MIHNHEVPSSILGRATSRKAFFKTKEAFFFIPSRRVGPPVFESQTYEKLGLKKFFLGLAEFFADQTFERREVGGQKAGKSMQIFTGQEVKLASGWDAENPAYFLPQTTWHFLES